MKFRNIRVIAEKYPTLTIRFTPYQSGIMTRVETNRKIVISDVIKGIGDLKRLIEKAIEKLDTRIA